MSVEDEIRRTTQRLQQAKREADEAERRRITIENAFRAADMLQNTPRLIWPPAEIRDIIKETLPHMQMDKRKYNKEMPDDTVRVRKPIDNYDSRSGKTILGGSNCKSFDVMLYSSGSGKGSFEIWMWVFNNGAIAFSKSGVDIKWAEIKTTCNIDSTGVRSLIIKQISQNLLDTKATSQNTSRTAQKTNYSSVDDPCCYVATHIYGSYDCPEVWVLRRFRDNVLKKSIVGRNFIRLYYRISPKLIRVFGNHCWFNGICRKMLNHMICSLKQRGFSDQRYKDL